MNADLWIKLLNAIISLILGISWPLVALFLLAYLRVPIKKFIENMIEINLKAGPIETTAKRQTIEAAASLGAAIAIAEINEKSSTNKDLVESKITNITTAREVASLINQIVTPRTLHKIQGARILWVDDRPSNNLYEREALSALDIQLVLSNSTEDALKKLGEENFNVIISDMGRPPDARAGYTLLEKVQKLNVDAPYIIYAFKGDLPEHQREARSKGAFASVSRPAHLFEKVINALVYDLE
jgi:CheY-like chemotaxis protein/Na+-transporting methylmalonyl-CoA/oxaloacetate decarboxylase gamma subunit